MNDHGLPPIVRAWRDQGRFVRVAGIDVFVVDAGDSSSVGGPAGGAPSAEANVVLHGFPSSSSDWRLVLARLRSVRRTVLFDFPGYGLSEKPERYSYSLMEQCDVVLLVLRELGIERAHVIAHDMGTSVACELVARRERGLLPIELESLVLMNGSVHIEMSRLTPSQKILLTRAGPLLARFGSWRVFRLQLRRILAKPVPEDELEAMWAQLAHRDGRRRLPVLIKYVEERRRFWHRWIGALTRLDVPTLVLWGTEDPVAVIGIAEKLASEIPGAVYRRLEGVGHYPMIEDPDATGAELVAFLSR